MTKTPHPGGRGRIAEFDVARIGYGAMQLEPDATSTDDAVALLRRAVELGIDHVDTASFYSDGEVNRRIRTALAPYRDDLVIVSKVGARSAAGGRIPLAAAQRPAELLIDADLGIVEVGLAGRPVGRLGVGGAAAGRAEIGVSPFSSPTDRWHARCR